MNVAACACAGAGGALAAVVHIGSVVVVVVAAFEAATVVPVMVLAAMAEVRVVGVVVVSCETLVVPGESVAVVVGGPISGHPIVAVVAIVPDVVREVAVAFEVATEVRVEPVCGVGPPGAPVVARRARADGVTPSREDDAVNALDVVVSAGPTRARPSGVVLNVVVVDAAAVLVGAVRPALVEGGPASTLGVSTGGLVTAAACSGGTVVGSVGSGNTVVGSRWTVVGSGNTVVGSRTVVRSRSTVVGSRSTGVVVVVVRSVVVDAEVLPGTSTSAETRAGAASAARRTATPAHPTAIFVRASGTEPL